MFSEADYTATELNGRQVCPQCGKMGFFRDPSGKCTKCLGRSCKDCGRRSPCKNGLGRCSPCYAAFKKKSSRYA